MSEQLQKRLKSLGWRLGGFVLVAVLSVLLEPENLSTLREAGLVVPATAVTVLSLIVNEISKYLNKKS
jgi:hypothetical protein